MFYDDDDEDKGINTNTTTNSNTTNTNANATILKPTLPKLDLNGDNDTGKIDWSNVKLNDLGVEQEAGLLYKPKSIVEVFEAKKPTYRAEYSDDEIEKQRKKNAILGATEILRGIIDFATASGGGDVYAREPLNIEGAQKLKDMEEANRKARKAYENLLDDYNKKRPEAEAQDKQNYNTSIYKVLTRRHGDDMANKAMQNQLEQEAIKGQYRVAVENKKTQRANSAKYRYTDVSFTKSNGTRVVVRMTTDQYKAFNDNLKMASKGVKMPAGWSEFTGEYDYMGKPIKKSSEQIEAERIQQYYNNISDEDIEYIVKTYKNGRHIDLRKDDW